jgi:hypothetical protein
MKANFLICLLVFAGLSTNAFAVKPIKPPPPPVTAEDVVCDGCVNTIDIEDGAVTTNKLSTQLQQQNDALRSDIDANQSVIANLSCSSYAPPIPQFCVKRVFLTANDYTSDMGGVAAANAICQSEADAANLGGTWKAWISDSLGATPQTSFFRAGRYELLDGTMVAYGWDDLTNPNTRLLAPIDLTPLLSHRPPVWVWTGTTIGGQEFTDFGQQPSCNNWTLISDDLITQSNSSLTTEGWTSSPDSWGMYCNEERPLYCFEQ